jgi:hypothetical protein
MMQDRLRKIDNMAGIGDSWDARRLNLRNQWKRGHYEQNWERGLVTGNVRGRKIGVIDLDDLGRIEIDGSRRADGIGGLQRENHIALCMRGMVCCHKAEPESMQGRNLRLLKTRLQQFVVV